jgi:uncharacterized caspase-like protein
VNQWHFALVIGINCYPGMTRQLTSARADAEAFAAWLTTPNEGGLEPTHVETILADPEEERGFHTPFDARPLYHEAIHALARFHNAVKGLPKEQWLASRLYVYVAGHGVAPPEGRGALLFADSAPADDFWGSALFDLGLCDLLYERITPFHEVLLLADCCREVSPRIPPATALTLSGSFRWKTRRVLGYATPYSRKAGAPRVTAALGQEDHANGRGFFTQAVLEGLRGRAARDPVTGAVTTSLLEDYVVERVSILAGEAQYEQEADFTRSGSFDLVPGVVPRHPVEIVLPPGWRGRVEIRNDAQGQPVRSTGDVSGTWVEELKDGLYEVAATPAPPGPLLFKVEGGRARVELRR